jgi:hypothetical protein
MYTLVLHIFMLVYWGINPRNKWKEKPGQPVSQSYDSIMFSLRFVEWLSIAIQLFKGTCKACKRMILNHPRISEWFQVIGFPETPIAGQGRPWIELTILISIHSGASRCGSRPFRCFWISARAVTSKWNLGVGALCSIVQSTNSYGNLLCIYVILCIYIYVCVYNYMYMYII